jgi:hypothetical protein
MAIPLVDRSACTVPDSSIPTKTEKYKSELDRLSLDILSDCNTLTHPEGISPGKAAEYRRRFTALDREIIPASETADQDLLQKKKTLGYSRCRMEMDLLLKEVEAASKRGISRDQLRDFESRMNRLDDIKYGLDLPPYRSHLTALNDMEWHLDQAIKIAATKVVDSREEKSAADLKKTESDDESEVVDDHEIDRQLESYRRAFPVVRLEPRDNPVAQPPSHCCRKAAVVAGLVAAAAVGSGVLAVIHHPFDCN